jgi:cellulose synthase/poly-beta-1,6-N-acetylglucosamine synthase-like glycosyltransferase
VMIILLVLYALLSALLFGVALTSLCWMLEAWRTPTAFERTGFLGSAEPRFSFSLVVPARHEEAVLGATLERLAEADHPAVEILAVVGHDDPDTYRVAQDVADRRPDRVRVVIDNHWPKNKPKALNTALGYCSGAIVGVFDAEDEVSPALLRHVDTCFQVTRADVVQGGVQLMNFRSSWWALRNVLEYFFWFHSRLHFHARQGFIPLGGNTVFVRRAVLREIGGWDPECLAEDCDLGVRLSTRGARIEVAYDPALVTKEETPATLMSLFKQRTRWNQGFLQVLRKGDWRRLPTLRQRLLARYTLSMPFLQAIAGVMIPMSLITMITLRAPVLLVLLSWAPLIPALMTVAVEAAGMQEFCRAYYGIRPGARDYLRLVLGTLVYQVVLCAAAARAVARELVGRRSWEKTAHVGAHRTMPVPDSRVAA